MIGNIACIEVIPIYEHFVIIQIFGIQPNEGQTTKIYSLDAYQYTLDIIVNKIMKFR